MRARITLLCGVLACVGGCAQLLGLGDYGDADERGPGDATATADLADGVVSDHSLDQTPSEAEPLPDRTAYSDALAPQSNDDATADADTSETLGLDAAMDAGFDAPSSDAVTEATVDAEATDAPADAVVDACPTICNGGCGDGGTCTITMTTAMSAPLDCPAGFACHAVCAGTQVCTQAINCAVGQPCTVSCSGDQACSTSVINRGGASSLCVDCLASGNPGCDQVTCTGFCTIHCVGGCGGSCRNCVPVFACP